MQALDDCISRSAAYTYNENHGLTNYITPYVNLFCIQYNNAPPIGRYYKGNEVAPTSAQMKAAKDEPFAKGFQESALSSDSSATNWNSAPLYKIGDMMKTLVTAAIIPP